jgi:hypothetical protein
LGTSCNFDSCNGKNITILSYNCLKTNKLKISTIVGLYPEKLQGKKMKHTIKAIRKFIEKEWFLLITATAITVIIVLFELLS